MIKVYYRGSCGSSQRAFSWFLKHKLDVQKKQISKITRNDLIKLLQFSDEGLKEIVKRPSKSKTEVRELLKHLEILSFNEAIDFLILNPCMLQTPIIMARHNHLVGYNEDDIRMFLPKQYRRHRSLKY